MKKGLFIASADFILSVVIVVAFTFALISMTDVKRDTQERELVELGIEAEYGSGLYTLMKVPLSTNETLGESLYLSLLEGRNGFVGEPGLVARTFMDKEFSSHSESWEIMMLRDGVLLALEEGSFRLTGKNAYTGEQLCDENKEKVASLTFPLDGSFELGVWRCFA